MRAVPDWDQYFLDLARVTASRSKDPNTQVGAVIVNQDGRIISQGYNGMPQGFPEEGYHWGDDAKKDLVIHAELNAVANAARCGASTLGGTMYLTLAPCIACARVIVASGMAEVVFIEDAFLKRIKGREDRATQYAASFHYLERAGVRWRMV